MVIRAVSVGAPSRAPATSSTSVTSASTSSCGPACQCDECQKINERRAQRQAELLGTGARESGTQTNADGDSYARPLAPDGSAPDEPGSAGPRSARGHDGRPLTGEQQQQIEKLKARDAEVKQHEAAHLAAAGALAKSGPHYDYQQGPDGKSYAVGGHVDIDTSPGKTPQETIARARQARAAALAPGDPSGQDRAVAAQAAASEAQAQAQQVQLPAARPGEAEGTRAQDQSPPSGASTGSPRSASSGSSNPAAVINALARALSATGGSSSTSIGSLIDRAA